MAVVATMNVSLPDELKAFVDAQVATGRYGSSSEFVRELIRREQARRELRDLVLEGAASDLGPVADEAYFASLRSLATELDGP